jgi:hypothetical protein
MTERQHRGEAAPRLDRPGRTLRESDRATLARLAAHERWARVRDRSAATAAARSAADDRFVAEARRFHPGLAEEEILKRARNLRSAHAIRAARARWRKTNSGESNELARPCGKAVMIASVTDARPHPATTGRALDPPSDRRSR